MTGALDPEYVEWFRPMVVGAHGVTWVDAFRAMARDHPWVKGH